MVAKGNTFTGSLDGKMTTGGDSPADRSHHSILAFKCNYNEQKKLLFPFMLKSLLSVRNVKFLTYNFAHFYLETTRQRNASIDLLNPVSSLLRLQQNICDATTPSVAPAWKINRFRLPGRPGLRSAGEHRRTAYSRRQC